MKTLLVFLYEHYWANLMFLRQCSSRRYKITDLRHVSLAKLNRDKKICVSSEINFFRFFLHMRSQTSLRYVWVLLMSKWVRNLHTLEDFVSAATSLLFIWGQRTESNTYLTVKRHRHNVTTREVVFWLCLSRIWVIIITYLRHEILSFSYGSWTRERYITSMPLSFTFLLLSHTIFYHDSPCRLGRSFNFTLVIDISKSFTSLSLPHYHNFIYNWKSFFIC